MFKKIVISFLTLFLVGAVIFYFFGSSILSKSVKTIVETVGPKVTQTPVRLDTVKLSVLSGDGQLSGLYIGNPEGFSNENIFALGQIEVDLETGSLRSDELVINKIYIKEPLISYEKKLRTSNLKELLKNIEESTGGSSDTKDTEESKPEESTGEESSEPSKNVLIKEFILEQPKVFLGAMGVEATVILPSIELNNISSSEEEIAATILQQVIAQIFNGIKSGAVGDSTDEILDAVNQPLKDVKNLFGK